MKETRHKLIILCGIPASGKSTWVKMHKDSISKTTKVVSRDKIRFSLLKEGEGYFSKEKQVFNTFIEEIKKGLIENEVTIADATHLNENSRRKLLNALGTSLKNIETDALFIKVNLETALERNSHRAGRALVPEDSIKNMYLTLTPPTLEEGFNKVYIYENGKYIIKEKGSDNNGKDFFNLRSPFRA